ncbi:MAG: hypothetical protein WAO21_11175 [Verrucomicrobiia bacterium]
MKFPSPGRQRLGVKSGNDAARFLACLIFIKTNTHNKIRLEFFQISFKLGEYIPPVNILTAGIGVIEKHKQFYATHTPGNVALWQISWIHQVFEHF